MVALAILRVQRYKEILNYERKMKKKYEIICIIQKKAVPLHSQMRQGLQSMTDKPLNGALDERFSLWSAKPAKAVRLRHAPLRKRLNIIMMFNLFSFLVF